MFCIHCGSKNKEGAVLCKKCGRKVESVHNIELNNPDSSLLTYKYKATIARRWVAVFLDSIVVTVAWILISVLFSIENSRLLDFIVLAAYNIFFVWQSGATLGKKIMKIRVVGIDKEKLTIGRVILRETLGKLLSFWILGLGYLTAIKNKDKQTWHDRIAKTYVVTSVESSGKEPWWLYLLLGLLFIIPILGILAAVLLVAVDPSEQLSKAKDTNNRATSIELLAGNQRYYATYGNFPWNISTNSYCKKLKAKLSSANDSISLKVEDQDLEGCLSEELISKNKELSENLFVNLEKDRFMIDISKGTSLVVCYKPQSKNQIQSSETTCDSSNNCLQCFN